MDNDGTCENSQVSASKKWLTLAALTCNWQMCVIGVTTNERDLVVQIDQDLKFNQHVETVTSKANRMLGMIRRTYIQGRRHHQEAIH